MAVAVDGLTKSLRLAEQIGDETARAKLVQLPGGTLEEAHGTLVEILFRELELTGEIAEELALLVGALPRPVAVDRTRAAARGGSVAVRVAVVTVAMTVVAMTVGSTVRCCGFAVGVTGDKPGLLDLTIDGILEQSVEARGLVGDLGEVGQFGLAGDAELVGAVAGQAQPLGVIGDEFDCHGV